MRLIVQHGRDMTGHLAQCLVLHDDESHTRRRQVLLRTSVDTDILGHIHRTGEDIRRHISHHRHVHIQVGMQFRTIDCIVRRDMEIIRIGRHFVILRNIRVAILFGRSHLNRFAESLGFLHGLLGPCTRVQVSRFLFQEIIGNHTELQACTSTQEQYRVSFRNMQQFLEQRNRFIHHRLEVFRAVTDFHQRKS